jgi:hypothetical protein
MIDRDINVSQPNEWAVFFDELRQLKGVHSVEIHKRRRKASQEQHGYYRAVVLPIARRWLNETQGGIEDDRDYTDAEAHVWLKAEFAGRPVIDPKTGECRSPIAKSCAEMSSVEMFELTDAVVQHLHNQWWRVPPPDREWRENRARALKEKELAHV